MSTRLNTALLLGILSVGLFGCQSVSKTAGIKSGNITYLETSAIEPSRPKNVILFISDGAGPASFTFARDYLRAMDIRQQLYLDDILVGSVETSSASHLITGSAPSATAMSTGVKTTNLFVGVDQDGNPLTNIVEKAEQAGLSTGIVVTREVTDATPAAFTAHVRNRYDGEMDIAIQQINSGIDLLVGGGLEMFTPKADGGKRDDGRDLKQEAREKGYQIATSRNEWESISQLPAIALLAQDKLAYEIDRNPVDAPSLSELTAKAINLLDAENTGFFLMVEGSRIDMAGHDNDAVAHLSDIIAYDSAVKVALDFAKEDGNTLVLSVSDHETGGLTVGRKYTWNPKLLSNYTASHDTVVTRLKSGIDPREVMSEFYSIDSLSDEEYGTLQSVSSRNDYDRALGEIIGDRLLIGWESLGHTAVDVGLYAFGPGSEHFRGHFDHAHMGITLPRLLGLE